jgi:hypothetical protein
MFTIHLNIKSICQKQCFHEKEDFLKKNIIAKLKLSKKYENDITKNHFIEKEISLLTKKLDILYSKKTTEFNSHHK